jgi:hypothetical protein
LFCGWFLVVWGLDPRTGEFKNEQRSTNNNDTTKRYWWMWIVNPLIHNENKKTVRYLLSLELENLYEEVDNERMKFDTVKYQTEREKGKRLLFLLQKDLMPGISGQILECKDQRDEVVVKGVSKSAKVFAWSFLAILNLSMLFYVFLFAISQDPYHQRAWAKSFGIWFVVDLLLVSSCTVCFMHVFIPSITMKDVNKIRRKLVESIIKYETSVSDKDPKYRNDTNSDDESMSTFNAAKYLFLSYRMATLYPDLKVSQIIQQFSTPWPRQSYQHVTDMAKEYDRKFDALSRSASMIAMFFLSNLLTVPLAVQDMIMQMCTTTATGYTILLHIQLYKIYPVLIAIPTIVIAALIHFFIQSKKADSKVTLARMIHDATSHEKEEKEKRRQQRLKNMKNKVKPDTSPFEHSLDVSTNSEMSKNESKDNISSSNSFELSSADSDSQNERMLLPWEQSSSHESVNDKTGMIDEYASNDSASIILSSETNSSHPIEESISLQQDVQEIRSPQVVTALRSPVTSTSRTSVHVHHMNRRESVQQGIALWRRVADQVRSDETVVLNAVTSTMRTIVDSEDDHDDDEDDAVWEKVIQGKYLDDADELREKV